MTLWIGYGAVPKNSSQWQLKEFWKLNDSGHELFIFKIPLIASSIAGSFPGSADILSVDWW